MFLLASSPTCAPDLHRAGARRPLLPAALRGAPQLRDVTRASPGHPRGGRSTIGTTRATPRRRETRSSTRSPSRCGPPSSPSCSGRSPPRPCPATSSSGAMPSASCIVLPLALPGIVTGIALERRLRPPRRRPLPGHPGHRSRHLLHRDRVQQRGRSHAPALAEHRRGLSRPRRRPAPDLPLRAAPAHDHLAARRRLARVRAELRRDHRHHVHRRGRVPDPAAVDLRRTCSATRACPW